MPANLETDYAVSSLLPPRLSDGATVYLLDPTIGGPAHIHRMKYSMRLKKYSLTKTENKNSIFFTIDNKLL
jgi:hypothetical protein